MSHFEHKGRLARKADAGCPSPLKSRTLIKYTGASNYPEFEQVKLRTEKNRSEDFLIRTLWFTRTQR